MPQIQLLDGKKIDFKKSISGFDLTKKISKSLEKIALIMEVNGDLKDLSHQITTDAKVFLDCGDIFVSNTGEPGADETEPAVRGQSLQDWLQKLLDDYAAHIHPTGVGPSGPPMPPTPSTVGQLSSTHINYQQRNK